MERYEMNNLGLLHHFSGLKVHQDKDEPVKKLC